MENGIKGVIDWRVVYGEPELEKHRMENEY